VFAEAVRIANPDDDWAVLRAVPGGTAIVTAWRPRDAALAGWRSLLTTPGPGAAGISRDDALRHILHGHYIRAYGIARQPRVHPERPAGRTRSVPGNRPHRFRIHRRIDSHATASFAPSTSMLRYQLGT